MANIFKDILDGGNNIRMRNFTGCDRGVNHTLADCDEMSVYEFMDWFKED